MRHPLIGAMAVFGAFALILLVLFAALATYDTMADNDMMDGMWKMMDGMMDDGMGDMMDGMMGSRNSPQTTGSATGRGEVTIEDFRFEPTVLNVTPGTVVTWMNQDAAPHTATAQDGSFDTGTLGKTQVSSITFDNPGDYPYYCKLHWNMKGRISVH